MKLVLKYPVFFSIVLIALIILGGRVFNAIFEINQDLKKIVFNIVIIISLYFFIYSKQTPFKLFNRCKLQGTIILSSNYFICICIFRRL